MKFINIVLVLITLSLVTPSTKGATLTAQASSNGTSLVFVNTPGSMLGAFDTVVTGEPVAVSNMRFTLNSAATIVRSVVITTSDKSAVLAGPVDTQPNGSLTFTDTITFPVGTNTCLLLGTLAIEATDSPLHISTTPFTMWSSVVGTMSGSGVELSTNSVDLGRTVIFGRPSGTKIDSVNLTRTPEVTVIIGYKGVSGYIYTVEESSNLIRWTSPTNGYSIAGPLANWDLPEVLYIAQPADKKFYRLAERPASRLSVSKAPNVITQDVVSGGSSNARIAAYRFNAPIEAVSIRRLGIKRAAVTSNADFGEVKLWDGQTQVGTAFFTGITEETSIALTAPVVIPKGSFKDLSITTEVSSIGIGQPGRSGNIIVIDYASSRPDLTQVVGAISGENIQPTGETGTDGVRIYKSLPVCIADTLPSTGMADGKNIRFRISADQAGDISLAKTSFLLQGTNVTATNFTLYCYEDAGYSVPASGLINGNMSVSGRLSVSQSGYADTNTVYSAGPIQGMLLEMFTQDENTNASALVIPAGQTRFFELRSNLQILSAGAFLSVHMVFNTPATGSTTMDTWYRLIPNLNFIWSPHSTGIPNLTSSVDWTGSPWRTPPQILQIRTP